MKTSPKIAGKFVRIKEEWTTDREHKYFEIDWIDASNALIELILKEDFTSEDARRAEQEIEELQTELARTSDATQVEGIKRRIEHKEVVALWPKIYKAYCRGERLEDFFEGKAGSADGTDKASAKVILLKKVREECENRHLPKGVTIDPKTKYAIALAVGIKPLPGPKQFKSRNKTYHRISKMFSELGYKRRKAAKYQ